MTTTVSVAERSATQFGYVRHPRASWSRLLEHPSRLRYSAVAVLSVGIGYAITAAGIAQSGGTPSPPWLAIPPADYFRWEALFAAPVTVLCWILAGGVVHLLSKVFHGTGTFEDTLAVLGFAVGLSTLITLVPDGLRAVLTTVGVLNRASWEEAVSHTGSFDWLVLWSYMVGYLLGLMCLFSLSASAAQHLRRWPSIAVGLAGVLVYQGVYVIFMR